MVMNERMIKEWMRSFVLFFNDQWLSTSNLDDNNSDSYLNIIKYSYVDKNIIEFVN